jgi:hypothetical protein
MHRRHSTPRASAPARAASAARAQAPAFDAYVRVALLATLAVVLLLVSAFRAGAMTLSTACQPVSARTIDSVPPITDPSAAPSPQLTPDDVVAIVLDALSRNDIPVKDHGISVTFTFSSPANRAFVGPIESFADLVRDDTYRPLLYHRHAARGVAHVNGDRATVRVVVTTAAGERVAYLFALSRQTDGQYRGCWMTDGVTREPPSPLAGMRSAD